MSEGDTSDVLHTAEMRQDVFFVSDIECEGPEVLTDYLPTIPQRCVHIIVIVLCFEEGLAERSNALEVS